MRDSFAVLSLILAISLLLFCALGYGANWGIDKVCSEAKYKNIKLMECEKPWQK